ncbi:MAG: (Fe-S)-binding protein [bacterium]
MASHGIYRNIGPLSQYRNQAWKCVRCGLCRMVNPERVRSHKWSAQCPAGTRFLFEAYYGSGKQEMVRALSTDSPELALSKRMQHIIYTCTLCGACQATCNFAADLEPTNASVALREHAVREGWGPLPQHEPLIKSILNYDNPWLQPRAAREKWTRQAKGVKVKDAAKERVEVLYYPGCTASYDPEIQPVAREVVRLLQAAGVDFGILGKNEICCGSTILRVGDRENFEKVRARSSASLNATGARTIVTACAGCYSTLKKEYGEDLEPQVVHIVEFANGLVEQGRLKPTREVRRKVTYHDPCHLGRYCGVYDAPRNILRSIPGLEFREMERIRDWAWCCAAGGGVRTAFPEEMANWAAGLRLEEARETGADTLVTACPFCEQNLGEAAKGGTSGLQVVDILKVLAEAVG